MNRQLIKPTAPPPPPPRPQRKKGFYKDFNYEAYLKTFEKPKKELPKTWDEYGLVMTLKEVCALLKSSEPTIIKLIKSGKLPASKETGKWLIDKNDIRKMFKIQSEHSA